MDTEFTTQVPNGNGPDLLLWHNDKLGALVANGVVAPVDLGAAVQFRRGRQGRDAQRPDLRCPYALSLLPWFVTTP